MRQDIYNAQRAATKLADAKHEARMQFFAAQLGCDRSKLGAKMAHTPKHRLDAISAEYDALLMRS